MFGFHAGKRGYSRLSTTTTRVCVSLTTSPPTASCCRIIHLLPCSAADAHLYKVVVHIKSGKACRREMMCALGGNGMALARTFGAHGNVPGMLVASGRSGRSSRNLGGIYLKFHPSEGAPAEVHEACAAAAPLFLSKVFEVREEEDCTSLSLRTDPTESESQQQQQCWVLHFLDEGLTLHGRETQCRQFVESFRHVLK